MLAWLPQASGGELPETVAVHVNATHPASLAQPSYTVIGYCRRRASHSYGMLVRYRYSVCSPQGLLACDVSVAVCIGYQYCVADLDFKHDFHF